MSTETIDRTNEQTTNSEYKEFYSTQKIRSLAIGDRVSITINGEVYFTYDALYSNCHMNLVIQDKGGLNTKAEKINAQIAELQRKKEELVSK